MSTISTLQYEIKIDYEMGEFIGKGSFGSVRKAKRKIKKDKQDNAAVVADKESNDTTIYAIKELAWDGKTDPNSWKGSINREKDILVKLSNSPHPHIVQLYRVYEKINPLCYYLVFEYIGGRSLYERIREMKSYTENDARNMIKHVLLAIQHCHHLNIAHR
jgi:serine/threonine protein kinase